MLLDNTNMFSNNQAVTATANSTNVIDLWTTQTSLGGAARDLGPDQDLKFFLLCTLTALAAGAATVTFSLVMADDAALTTNVTTLWATEAIGKASILTGTYLMRGAVPVNRLKPQRYMGVIYTVATGPLTQGTFSSGLALDLPANIAYQEGINVGGF